MTVTCLKGNVLPHGNIRSTDVAKKIALCEAWHNAEPHPSIFSEQTPKCPCHVLASFPKVFNDGSKIWKTDPGCIASQHPNTCKYHKGAHGCYRFAYKSTGPGAQCCYNKNGVWIKDPHRGAGTLDRERAPDSFFDLSQLAAHHHHDVVPWENCCKDPAVPRDVCQLYFDKRPPGVCEKYTF
ncbi:unnamed protein product [Rotaria magnacalcarata]|uniref:AMOP domain-containing protein n=1 Tax=Rotaria magnacalcarata TaxID=392030 RepID=A0A816S0N0_9BILA|nr:unnamed protein product [Rotaria magnacalcarata]CAF3944291.1 unnamed protein product [Rotaria magnacalcarata]